ncbi:aldolase/citrate lyase family protein [Streptomyces sulphureus]|uniref:aldolase/citrate lyase family protein n=1 Tax=Streptomyces sulphureus TaxID=47758 RepID=UPI00036D0F31|nr:aldolase/citrate lyase family protein [Streptomyces sulphureus]
MATSRWAELLTGDRPQIGMWLAAGSPYCAEICAGSGLDWFLLDQEHAPNDLHSTLAQLQALAPYPPEVVVRPVDGEPAKIKQLLDIGVRNLMVPMVENARQAEVSVAATRYPPHGIRGVGSALARASRWNRRAGYLAEADAELTLTVQIESPEAVGRLKEIASVEGVDAVFLGPADLAAAMGHLGEPEHPEVVATIERALGTIVSCGKPAGVNAFNETYARRYLAAGARFVLVGADVTLLARGSEALAERYGCRPCSV